MPGPARRTVRIARLPVELTATDDGRWRAMEALFGTCPTADGDPVLSVAFVGSAPAAPSRPADVRFSDVELWYGDQGAVTRHASGLVIVRDGGAILAGGPDLGADLPRAFRRSLQHVLVDALVEHGCFGLHAAALARGADAVVVLGDTGAGKSTLAISAQRAGWEVLTDDIVWLELRGIGLALTGFPKPLHVPPDLRGAVPSGGVPLVGDDRGRYIATDGLTTDDTPRVLRGVVVVRHGEGAGGLAPIEAQSERVRLAMRSFPLQAHPPRVRQFLPVATRLARAPAVTLAHAEDPARRADRAAAMLAEAWAAFTAVRAQ